MNLCRTLALASAKGSRRRPRRTRAFRCRVLTENSIWSQHRTTPKPEGGIAGGGRSCAGQFWGAAAHEKGEHQNVYKLRSYHSHHHGPDNSPQLNVIGWWTCTGISASWCCCCRSVCCCDIVAMRTRPIIRGTGYQNGLASGKATNGAIGKINKRIPA